MSSLLLIKKCSNACTLRHLGSATYLSPIHNLNSHREYRYTSNPLFDQPAHASHSNRYLPYSKFARIGPYTVPQKLGTRSCFHPGVTENMGKDQLPKAVKEDVTGWQIVKAMVGYVWPKDQPALRFRVVTAFSLLVGAKVMNVQVPFLFKYLVDHLNEGVLTLDNPGATVITLSTSLVLGCEFCMRDYSDENYTEFHKV